MAYDYRVTRAFLHVYEALDDDAVEVVDSAVQRLLEEHETAWARQGRVAGEHGEAWIVEIRSAKRDISLYWDYLEGRLILLAVLLVREA